MSQPLRLLLIEDSEDDAILLLRTLKKVGYEFEHERVDAPDAMQRALATASWDIIISDYVIPGFGGLEALKLSTKRPPIVFVGNGPLKTRLEAYTRKKRLPATFVGHVDRTALVARLVSSAFFFFPSFYEGHSMAVLEACAAGLPVVAFDNTGVQSSISESNRKLLPENGDLRGMAELMDALADSPSLRASLGKANREFSTRFSSARMVDAYEEWYLQANSFRWD